MINEQEAWAAEIAEHIHKQFRLSVNQAIPIDKGWLNVKWRMETDHGPIFVKYYHPDRYKFHLHPERKLEIQKTLVLQHELSLAGVRCPSVHQHKDQVIQVTSTGLHYAVLDWVDGHTMPAGCLSEDHMVEIGQHTGKMHNRLRSVKPLDKPAWQPDKEAYLSEWRNNWERSKQAGDEIALEWQARSLQLVQSLDFQMFGASPVGWLHWDLWVDNILVNGQKLAGIVDFDRMTMAYQEIDVARAILSGALHDGKLRMDAVQSFIEGYRQHMELPRGFLIRSIGMLYLIESNWWLRTEVRAESNLRDLLARFIEEMHWIEENLGTLQDQLGSLE